MDKPAQWLGGIRNDQKYIRIYRYILVGSCTTVISFGTFWLLLYFGRLDPNIANAISILVAVLFAYAANKNIVFKSQCKNVLELIGELFRFILSRSFTLLVEIAGLFLLYSILNINAVLSKIVVSIFVLIINYLSFHYIVFHKSGL